MSLRAALVVCTSDPEETAVFGAASGNLNSDTVCGSSQNTNSSDNSSGSNASRLRKLNAGSLSNTNRILSMATGSLVGSTGINDAGSSLSCLSPTYTVYEIVCEILDDQAEHPHFNSNSRNTALFRVLSGDGASDKESDDSDASSNGDDSGDDDGNHSTHKSGAPSRLTRRASTSRRRSTYYSGRTTHNAIIGDSLNPNRTTTIARKTVKSAARVDRLVSTFSHFAATHGLSFEVSSVGYGNQGRRSNCLKLALTLN